MVLSAAAPPPSRTGILLILVAALLCFFIISDALGGMYNLSTNYTNIGLPKNHTLYHSTPPKQYLAICAVVKDQHEDVMEWALYHMMLGVDTIYIFDHNSTMPMVNVLLPLIKSGHVVYNYFKDPPETSELNPQQWTYQQCIDNYWDLHQFMAFIDVDEFFVLHRGQGEQHLPNFLKQYQQFGAVGVNWRIMGSDNRTTRPPGGALENYLSCFPETEVLTQRQIKSIVNTNFNATVSGDPHHFDIADGSTVDVWGNIINGPYNDAQPLEALALQHYLFKSEEDFIQKSERGSGDRERKPMEFFELSKIATDTCPWGALLSKNLALFADKVLNQ